MNIKFTKHAKERAIQRGATKQEIENVLLAGIESLAKGNKKSKDMVFEYNREWLGKIYPQKKIKVIYVKERNDIIIITVKVFYGEWR
ncbi:MAG: DUF4258 domain-containing protein [Deltaproteobacteria bacterium]|nr:DUF4258 domain-containing protein [Deltaproteobacteria bacterium]MCL5792199.1 DUF4258 domain-containing protein [Deltaproteobacteria bacterium]